MSDRKEENFDFDSNFDEALFSNTNNKKGEKSSLEDHDLDDLLETEDESKQTQQDAAPIHDAVFGQVENQNEHHAQDFDHTMFDPQALNMEEEASSDSEDQAPKPEGLPALIQKVKEGWPYYAGVAAAIFFGIYLVSVILSDSTPSTPKASSPRVSEGQALGLTLQDVGHYSGPLVSEGAAGTQTGSTGSILSGSVVGSTPTPVAVGNMDRKEMVALIQEAVNNSVDKMGGGRELSGSGKLLREGSSGESVDEIKRMRKAIEMLVGRIEDYEQNLARVDAALTQLTTQLNLLVAQKTAQSDNLSLRAVIPGRAWLVDSQGRTYTVTQGDSIGNFGKIVQIDSEAGRVVTSSGYVFN